MSLLTSLLTGAGGGQDTLANDRYGVWKLTANFAVPVLTQVGLGTPVNRFPFDTVLSGSFADFNTTTHVLTVTKKGIYVLGWDGELASTDNFGGSVRRPVIRKTTSSLAVPILFTNTSALDGTATFGSAYGISRTTFLDVDDVVEFGFEYNGSINLPFSDETTLQIILLHTL